METVESVGVCLVYFFVIISPYGAGSEAVSFDLYPQPYQISYSSDRI